MSTADTDNEQVLSEESWGPFLPWRAAKAIRKLVKGDALLAALVLAIKTDRSGEIEIKHHEFAAEIGIGKNTVPKALKKCIDAGLLIGRRKLGGYKYVWGRVAYFPTEVDTVGRSGKNQCSGDSSALRDALRRMLRAVYLDCLKAKYAIRFDSPKAHKLLRLSPESEGEILDNLLYFYTSAEPKIDVGDCVEQALSKWFARDGKDGFLRRVKHPLARFADDCGDIVCALLSSSGRSAIRRADVQEAATVRVENRVSLREDVRQLNAQNGRETLAAMGFPRRPDFKMAANA